MIDTDSLFRRSIAPARVSQSMRMRDAPILHQTRRKIARFAPKFSATIRTNRRERRATSAAQAVKQCLDLPRAMQSNAGAFESHARALRSKTPPNFTEIRTVFGAFRRKIARIFGAQRTSRSQKSPSSMQAVGVDLQSLLRMLRNR